MKPVPRLGDNIHIPLKTDEAISLLLRVKPTAEMPRPGAHRSKSIVAEMNEKFGLGKRKRAKKAK